MFKRLIATAASSLALLMTSCAPEEAQQMNPSPRLSMLSTDFSRSGKLAVMAFWGNLDRTKTPMIEDVQGPPNSAFYTFILRTWDRQDAGTVHLAALMPPDNHLVFQKLTRFKDSDLWYASFTLPRDARIVYAFAAPKGSWSTPEPNAAVSAKGVSYDLLRDPLNPRTTGEASAAVSYVEGPNASSAAASREPLLDALTTMK